MICFISYALTRHADYKYIYRATKTHVKGTHAINFALSHYQYKVHKRNSLKTCPIDQTINILFPQLNGKLVM